MKWLNLVHILYFTVAIFTFIEPIWSAAVMSIDFGSEWLKVGIISPGVPMDMALNKESKRKTPTVMAYRDGVRTFGEDAQVVGVRFPKNAYFYLLDLLGKTVDNPLVQLYKKRFPYYEIIGDEKRNTVVFKNGEDLFRVEELVAQILTKAREFAEISADQPIKECVIIVPGFFGQAERTALLTAASLANLKVLQLMNDYTAVALNYGVFHRAEINETAQYYVFYDMGAQKTSAALVSYQLVKDKTTKETNPVVHVLGVGYDRTLGGLDIQLRLRDYLAEEFNKLKKTPNDVFKSPRALAKLFKEASRVKTILSANVDHYAQIENLIDDQDFRHFVTREKLEELSADLWPRVVKPLQQAIQNAGLSLDVVNQVIIFGGATRTPKVQEILRDYIKQELGKSLNADEAATMGAVYKAADLATGFKVKKFIIKDAVIFPIQVTFDRSSNGEDSNAIEMRQVKRLLFGHMNPYPQKKVITFNKHTNDFDFFIKYGDLNHLNEQEISYIGNLNITKVELHHVADLLAKNKEENSESKGIKAHFILDESGILELNNVDFVFEKQKPVTSDEEDDSAFNNLKNTISKFFTGNEEDTKKEQPKEDEENGDNKPTSGEEENGSKLNNKTTEQNATESIQSNSTVPKNETLKVTTVKEPVEHTLTYLFASPLSDNSFKEAQKKIRDLHKADMERIRKETALNSLESFILEARERLGTDEYASCATKEEIKNVLDECSRVSNWLDEIDHEESDTNQLEKQLESLHKLTDDIYARHWEHNERPHVIEVLENVLIEARKFYDQAKNLTKDKNPEKDVFTEVEVTKLKSVIDETIQWKISEVEAQKKLKKYEPVRLTVANLSDKMQELDREVKYLLHKLKLWRPKKPVKKDQSEQQNKTENGSTAKENEGKTNNNQDDNTGKDQTSSSNEEQQQQQNQGEKPISGSETTTTTERESETQTPRNEL